MPVYSAPCMVEDYFDQFLYFVERISHHPFLQLLLIHINISSVSDNKKNK